MLSLSNFFRSLSSPGVRVPSLSLFRFRYSSFPFFRSISFSHFFFFSLPQFFFLSLTQFRSLPRVFSLTYPLFFTSSGFFLFHRFSSILVSSAASILPLSSISSLNLSRDLNFFFRIPPHTLSGHLLPLSLSKFRFLSLTAHFATCISLSRSLSRPTS